MQEGSPRPGHDSLPAGTAIEDKYVITSDDVVGRGAWSVVKRCTPAANYAPPGARPGMSFVVKIIEKDYLISLTKGDVERAMAEVRREIDTLRHIPPHENVVTFIEHVETTHYFLLFFEEVRCGDLCELILQRPTGKLHEAEAKLYVYQLIKAVLHCHLHDVIHRDIKPENLLVSDDDTIKLTDFGLAKRARGVATATTNTAGSNGNSSRHTQQQQQRYVSDADDVAADALDLDALAMLYPGCERLLGKRITCSDVIGTPRYGAPEMFYAKFTQTHYDGYAADTWSIGVVTYIALSGSFPFSAGASASEKEVFTSIMEAPLVPPADVTPLALDFVECLLNKDPSTRLPLYATLTHPWLAEVVVPRGSIVATQIRGRLRSSSDDDDDGSDAASNSSSSNKDSDDDDDTMGEQRVRRRHRRRQGARHGTRDDLAAACARFDVEARQLHVCIARLQHELFRLQRKQQQQEQQQQHEQQEQEQQHTRHDSRSGRSGNKSASSRARTPCSYDDGLSSSSSSAAAMLHMRGSRASAARARVVSPARALGAAAYGLAAVHASNGDGSRAVVRGRMASRDNSSYDNSSNSSNHHIVATPGGYGGSRHAAMSALAPSSYRIGGGGATAAMRSKTPLARSAGGAAVRRGTPARTNGMTPRRSSTPLRATTAAALTTARTTSSHSHNSNNSGGGVLSVSSGMRATSVMRTTGRGASMATTTSSSAAAAVTAHRMASNGGGSSSRVGALSTRAGSLASPSSLSWTSGTASQHARATSAARGATPTRATALTRPRSSHAATPSSPPQSGVASGATPVKMTNSSSSNNNHHSYGNGSAAAPASRLYSNNNNNNSSNNNNNNNSSNNNSSSNVSVSAASELRLGDQVTYKGCRAVVRFNGTTTFGAGVWIGLEMLEGNEGTNDGSSFIDKRQYFTCPKGKGVFVRASQVKRL